MRKPWLWRELWILLLAVRKWYWQAHQKPTLTDEERNVFAAFSTFWADIEFENRPWNGGARPGGGIGSGVPRGKVA